MAEDPAVDPANVQSTLALNTKLEDSFVSPLTAIRGTLEILRDFPDLTADEQSRFINGALQECARLEAGVEELGQSVYAAGRQEEDPAPKIDAQYAARIRFDAETGLADIDFSDVEFSATALVNAFYDAIEAAVNPTGRRWIFLVNMTGCRIWPEAWVAFAHRGKKLAMNFSTAVLRITETGEGSGDYASRDEAVAAIEAGQKG